MHIYKTIDQLRLAIRAIHRNGQTVAFVPTMGNLHAGHIALVEQAKTLADKVVVSIFVNPTQFGPMEDYGAYPRTPEEDCAMLQAAHTDLLFLPTPEEMYPSIRGFPHTRVEIPELSSILCGQSRPTHFSGVATIVCKLFNIVNPDFAVFGEKDCQQLKVIENMVRDLCIPVKIIRAPIVREEDGLAMSSRNRYLSKEERPIAPLLYQALNGIAQSLLAGRRDFAELEFLAGQKLAESGFVRDYITIMSAELTLPQIEDQAFIVLGAAKLGRARLIDNVRVAC